MKLQLQGLVGFDRQLWLHCLEMERQREEQRRQHPQQEPQDRAQQEEPREKSP
jgi:hypothetical protein